jgi:hypothetical protein
MRGKCLLYRRKYQSHWIKTIGRFLGSLREPWIYWSSCVSELVKTRIHSAHFFFPISLPFLFRLFHFPSWCHLFLCSVSFCFLSFINSVYFCFMPSSFGSSIATGYVLDGWGVGVRVSGGARIFSSPRCPDWFWDPPSLLSNVYQELFLPGLIGRGVKLTIHLQLMSRSRMPGSPPYASWRRA